VILLQSPYTKLTTRYSATVELKLRKEGEFSTEATKEDALSELQEQ